MVRRANPHHAIEKQPEPRLPKRRHQRRLPAETQCARSTRFDCSAITGAAAGPLPTMSSRPPSRAKARASGGTLRSPQLSQPQCDHQHCMRTTIRATVERMPREYHFYVYMMQSASRRALYIGRLTVSAAVSSSIRITARTVSPMSTTPSDWCTGRATMMSTKRSLGRSN